MKGKLLLFLLTACLFAQDLERYFQPEKILAFARYLMEEEDWLRAAGELERYLKIAGEKSPPQVLFDLARCYEKAGLGDRALKLYSKLCAEEKSPLLRKAAWHKALLLVKMGKREEALGFLREWAQREGKFHYDFFSLQLYVLVNSGRYKEALSLINGSEKFLKENGELLRRLVAEGLTLPRKSPEKAALLSALLPGAGKVYAGRSLDGLYSFILIATSVWQAYSGFREGGIKSFKGWVFSGLALFFYAGNVYGSASAARIYNLLQERRFKKKIGLTLGFQF